MQCWPSQSTNLPELSECGTVPDYTPPELTTEVEPEPIKKTVNCENLIGNWVVVRQTRETELLQFSEIVITEGKSRWISGPYKKIPIHSKVDSTIVLKLYKIGTQKKRAALSLGLLSTFLTIGSLRADYEALASVTGAWEVHWYSVILPV